MKVSIIAVGRLKAGYAREGCVDFVRRSRRLLDVEIVEVRDVPRRKNADIDKCKADEAELLRAAIPRGARVVALDERGRGWGSRAFAEWLREQRDCAVPAVAFLIGGPDGLDEALREGADRVWSLGESTMSHELARLVLTEQIYRAGTIIAGLPYHRD